ncbi:EAL domain-containing protein, partial [Erwinia sp. MYb416]|uniref:EAL domain-containing protein n=1 Tax=Erwinia sp. MYb416 TaxID=3108532 RepID=UPI00309D6F29
DAIILLAQKLAMKVVAEGVESNMQLEYLKNRGVEYIQGYYYARPMDNQALMQWIAQQRTLAANPE